MTDNDSESAELLESKMATLFVPIFTVSVSSQ